MSQYMVQFAMCLVLNRTRMLKPDLPFSAVVRPQMHIYGQLSLKKNGAGWFRKKNESPCMEPRTKRAIVVCWKNEFYTENYLPYPRIKIILENE